MIRYDTILLPVQQLYDPVLLAIVNTSSLVYKLSYNIKT